jgi:hypothetical protein
VKGGLVVVVGCAESKEILQRSLVLRIASESLPVGRVNNKPRQSWTRFRRRPQS